MEKSDRFGRLNRQKIKPNKMKSLKDKVAVVFAASGQVAGAVARSFAEHGARVYVTAINLDAVEALAKKHRSGWRICRSGQKSMH